MTKSSIGALQTGRGLCRKGQCILKGGQNNYKQAGKCGCSHSNCNGGNSDGLSCSCHLLNDHDIEGFNKFKDSKDIENAKDGRGAQGEAAKQAGKVVNGKQLTHSKGSSGSRGSFQNYKGPTPDKKPQQQKQSTFMGMKWGY